MFALKKNGISMKRTSIDAVYGDDDLSDDLYNAYVNRPEDYDARIIVYHHLKDMIADYKENPKIFTVPADEKTTDAVIESINKILDDYFNSL
jgi:adenylate kinase family enzyme